MECDTSRDAAPQCGGGAGWRPCFPTHGGNVCKPGVFYMDGKGHFRDTVALMQVNYWEEILPDVCPAFHVTRTFDTTLEKVKCSDIDYEEN